MTTIRLIVGAFKRSSVLALLLILVTCHTSRATPFFLQLYNSDGSANSNLVLMTAWPSSINPFVVVGTNTIYEGNQIIIAPNAAGYASNWCYPGQYILTVSNVNKQFVVNVPDTTNFASIATYIVNQPVYAGISLNSFQLITNLLGYWPPTNNFSGIVFALGYTPATNNNAGIVFALGFSPATNSFVGITYALGYTPPTNTYAGITNALGFGPGPATNNFSGIVFALGYTPATNSPMGISNALGFFPATNSTSGIASALGYTPATNNNAGIVFALGFAPATNSNSGIVSALGFTPQANLGYTPATNSPLGISNALGFFPHTNSGYLGIEPPGTVSQIVTNGFIAWVAYKTNNDPGPAFTNLPQGSLMSTTNGTIYDLTNLVWHRITIQ